MATTEFRINNPAELKDVTRFLAGIRSVPVMVFQGNMGAGKTTLIKSICEELKVIDEVSSPTFSLINHYVTADNRNIYHFDFYRINDIREAADIGFEEYLENGALCLIEWPEKIMQLLDKPYVVVEIKAEDQIRMIKVHFSHESIR